MKFLDQLTEVITGAIRRGGSAFETMDPSMLGAIAICALALAAFWLRGNPVKGA